MLVKTHRSGGPHTGLLIGAANARRYFPPRAQTIDLMLDGLQIQCTLSTDFWQDRPEIHDPRLSAWLEFKVARVRRGRAPIELSLVPSGTNTFVLLPRVEKKDESFGAEVAPPKPVQSAYPTSADSAALQAPSVA